MIIAEVSIIPFVITVQAVNLIRAAFVLFRQHFALRIIHVLPRISAPQLGQNGIPIVATCA